MRRVDVAEHEVRMILQVLSDAGQVVRRGDAELCERCRIADAGQHQQLRGLECAEAEDHFAARAVSKVSLPPIFHTDRALAVEDDAGGVRAGLDLKGSAGWS